MPRSTVAEFNEIEHFHINNMTLTQEPLSGDHEIYNFGRPFLGHHYFKLSLSDLCPGVEEKIL